MVYKSKSQVIDLLFIYISQVIGLLCPLYYIKNPHYGNSEGQTLVHQYESQIYIKNPTFAGWGTMNQQLFRTIL